MVAISNVPSRPQPVEERFVAFSASGAAPIFVVVGRSLGIPDVVRDHRPQGIGLFYFAIGEEPVVDRLGAGEVRSFAVPEASTGGMWGDMLPHLLCKAVFYPKDVVGTVNGIGHVHGYRCVLDVVGVTSLPKSRLDRLDMELDQV